MLNRLRHSRVLRAVLVLIALGFVGYGLARHWGETRAAIAQLSWWSLAGSAVAFLIGLGCAMLAWREILAGLGSRLPVTVAIRVMFVGQLGKYIPGSVWAFAAMAELGRRHDCPPGRTFTATMISLASTLGCGLGLAAVTLPLTSGDAASAYLWVFALIPVILVGLHPKVLTFGLNLALRVARREPIERSLTLAAVVKAAGWNLAALVLYGVHLYLPLSDISGESGLNLLALATGAYALAWSIGILAVVVPAGAGIREVAMATVLLPVLPWAQGLVVAIVSRLVVTLADLVWAGIGSLLARTPDPATPEPRDRVLEPR
ncbi:lysylphosphatidylglycerol synthase transmembrane domain-containing protein [Rhizohabitans arisaemae]|uniref:lysylphosphatidylglycerol synthase transmembrane domain-containing protein n=1 Tax=Rhizohabitans arisaemae TaxID=2720610 RepID=UPI0024B22B5C|nr:lysylphosphatidylglycerol synthase domain-containing protein [Rhizohabitans arisaemae]